MKKLTIILMLAVLGIAEGYAIEFPQDLPTIEALIDLHKMIKGQEDAARDRIAVSFGEQSMVTKGANKFNDVRTTLNTKLSNGYSYILLAACLSSTANSLYKLIQEYSEFAQLSAKYTTKKPMVAWYFATALAKRYDETISFIEERRLEPWTHRKAIQKAIESFRVSDEHKEYLRTLRSYIK